MNYANTRNGVLGGPVAFSPASLPGYVDSPYSVAQLRAAGALWQNAAKTVPAVADADPVRVAVCGATEYTAPSDAARPLLFAEAGGKWSLKFDGTDDNLTANLSWPAVSVGSQMIGIVTAVGTASDQVAPVCVNNHDDWMSFTTGANYSFNFRSARADVLFTQLPSYPQTYCQASGTDYRAYIQGVLKGTIAAAWETPTIVHIGRSVAGGRFMTGRIAGLTLAAAGWDAATVERMQAFTSGLFP
ncbi:MAG TPA: hypothetical protein VMZ71_02355 [Gemmataceae bacterium]|nr:hypothetical protein [Gemmataceae bacterium]